MKQLHPRAVWLFFINLFIAWILFLLLIGASITVYFLGWAGDLLRGLVWLQFIAVILAAIAYVCARLQYHYYRYELADAGFKKEYGVIWKRYVTIPYERIQNVDIYRGVLARILGLSDLHIQTAGMSVPVGRYGGAASEGRLPGLSKEDAERLRDELIERARHSSKQGL